MVTGTKQVWRLNPPSRARSCYMAVKKKNKQLIIEKIYLLSLVIVDRPTLHDCVKRLSTRECFPAPSAASPPCATPVISTNV